MSGPLLRVGTGVLTTALAGSPLPMTVGIEGPKGIGWPGGPTGGVHGGIPGLFIDAAADPIPHGARRPEKAFPELARRTGIHTRVLSEAFHKIKKRAALQGDDSTAVDEEGDVYSSDTGENIGNVVDEAHGRG